MRISYYGALLSGELAIAEPTGPDEELCGDRPPLVKVAPGPWRSSGGYLDYTDWAERERFMELDLAIKCRQEKSLPQVEDRIQAPRRCRASIPDLGHCNAAVTLSEHYDGWKCEAHRTPDLGARAVAKVTPGALENFYLAIQSYNAHL